MQETFKVPDVSCDHCKTTIESALRPIDGIRSVQVVVEDKTATVDFDQEVIERSAVVAVIEEQGYPISA
ncbi:MAG: cation transporter [Actinomycetota bacterium]|nr:cation transporter [Actinomycetota bacterium]